MKILITLLFIAALPLMGQGRWVGKKQHDYFSYDNGKFVVESQPWIVALAINDWVKWSENLGYFKVIKKKLEESNTIDGTWSFYIQIKPNVSNLRVSLMGDFDTILRRAYYIPDTTIFNTLKSKAVKDLFLSINFSKVSNTETIIIFNTIKTDQFKSFNPNVKEKVEMTMLFLDIFDNLKRRVETFLELY